MRVPFKVGEPEYDNLKEPQSSIFSVQRAMCVRTCTCTCACVDDVLIIIVVDL